jgi:hypothetical protein
LVLFPVNINGGGKSKELDRLTIGNIKNPNKYYVHLFISWVFLGKKTPSCSKIKSYEY